LRHSDALIVGWELLLGGAELQVRGSVLRT